MLSEVVNFVDIIKFPIMLIKTNFKDSIKVERNLNCTKM